MHIVKLVSVICWVFYFSGSPAHVPGNEKLTWLTLSDAEAAYKKERRPILIDLYTNWCGWCKVMDKKTYSNKNVMAYLRDKFYIVRINAETKEQLSWAGKVYNYNNSVKVNDIALYLTQGQLSFPTTVLISAEGSEPQAIPGYLTPKEIEVPLKYFGENNFGKVGFQSYVKDLKTSW